MLTLLSRTARFTMMACLLAGSAAIGADDRRDDPGSDPTSTTEPLFYYEFAGANAGDVQLPEAMVSENLIMVYQHQWGLYPYIQSTDGEVINGGVPQNTNIRDHLRELVLDIENQIPEGFDGYVVIDYEEWTPFWEDTAERYREFSRQIIRDQHPTWDDVRVERQARVKFERAAKKVLLKTMNKCRKLRPDAMWGIWSYPKAKFRDNKSNWLWKKQDAFFPGVYMRNSLVPDGVEPGLGEANVSEYIQDILVGRVEYARELAGDRPVLAVAWPRYTHRNESEWLRLRALKQSDLAMCLEGPLDHGADGIVIWENIPQPGLAQAFQEQIDTSIAPEMERILTERGMPTDGDDTIANADTEGDDLEDTSPDTDTPETPQGGNRRPR